MVFVGDPECSTGDPHCQCHVGDPAIERAPECRAAGLDRRRGERAARAPGQLFADAGGRRCRWQCVPCLATGQRQHHHLCDPCRAFSATTKTWEWDTATQLSPDGWDPAAATNPSGDGVVVWTEGETSSSWRLRASRYHSGSGSWGAPVTVATAGAVSMPRVALDATGNAVVTWWQRNGSTAQARAARYTASAGSWAAPVDIVTFGTIPLSCRRRTRRGSLPATRPQCGCRRSPERGRTTSSRPVAGRRRRPDGPHPRRSPACRPRQATAFPPLSQVTSPAMPRETSSHVG